MYLLATIYIAALHPFKTVVSRCCLLGRLIAIARCIGGRVIRRIALDNRSQRLLSLGWRFAARLLILE